MDFNDKKWYILISVIIVVDFSISSCIWVISSPAVSEIGKVIYNINMVIFGLLPYLLLGMFKLHHFLRKESGKTPYPEESLEKQKRYKDLFIFCYTILLFSLNRVMDFIIFNPQSYFFIKSIYVISSNILVGFFFYVIEIKHKKTVLIIVFVTLNLVAILGLFL